MTQLALQAPWVFPAIQPPHHPPTCAAWPAQCVTWALTRQLDMKVFCFSDCVWFVFVRGDGTVLLLLDLCANCSSVLFGGEIMVPGL